MRALTVVAILWLVAFPACSGSDSTEGSVDEGSPPADTAGGDTIGPMDEGTPPTDPSQTDPGAAKEDAAECTEGDKEACANENEHGKCAGERTCLAGGTWGACDAPAPAAEVCNAADDDCDGETDEDTPALCNCGDGTCSDEGGESAEVCPCDCAECGDGVCSPCGESPATCKEDCCRTADGPSTCGDGYCLGYGCAENPQTCAADCGRTCGNGKCERSENPAACPEDCRRQECGNNICEPTDGGPEACAADCAAECGDCECQGTEGWLACPLDCGFCGDGVCSSCAQLGEDEERCPEDCKEDFEPPAPLGCAPRLRPETLRLGLTQPTGGAYMSFEIVNEGSGECVPAPDSLRVIDCVNPLSGAQPCLPGVPAEPPGDSERFMAHAMDMPDSLGPDQSLKLSVSFSAPPSRQLVAGTFERFAGLLSMAFSDPEAEGQEPVYVPAGFEPDREHEVPPNVTAAVGLSHIRTSGHSLGFDEVTVGCASDERKLFFFNRGEEATEVALLRLDPLCAGDFELSGLPSFPFSLEPLGALEVGARYKPRQASEQMSSTGCNVRLLASDLEIPEIPIELWGMASEKSERQDSLAQPPSQKDILFVVDDSESTAAARKAVASVVGEYFKSGQDDPKEFRLALTTTNVEAEDGRFKSDPRIVNSEAMLQRFAETIEALGSTDGAPVQAMKAAAQALSLPHTFVAADEERQPVDCSSSEECAPHGCYARPGDLSSEGGLCGGPNWGFPNAGRQIAGEWLPPAALHIVVVTDKDDSSPMPPSAYLAMLDDLDRYDYDSVRVHALAGDVPGGCAEGAAAEATALKEAVDASGGFFASICGEDPSQAFTELLDAIYAQQLRFRLKSVPTEAGATGSQFGETCQANGNWTLDREERLIQFEEDASCRPSAGGSVMIKYEAECLAP